MAVQKMHLCRPSDGMPLLQVVSRCLRTHTPRHKALSQTMKAKIKERVSGPTSGQTLTGVITWHRAPPLSQSHKVLKAVLGPGQLGRLLAQCGEGFGLNMLKGIKTQAIKGEAFKPTKLPVDHLLAHFEIFSLKIGQTKEATCQLCAVSLIRAWLANHIGVGPLRLIASVVDDHIQDDRDFAFVGFGQQFGQIFFKAKVRIKFGKVFCPITMIAPVLEARACDRVLDLLDDGCNPKCSDSKVLQIV